MQNKIGVVYKIYFIVFIYFFTNLISEGITS